MKGHALNTSYLWVLLPLLQALATQPCIFSWRLVPKPRITDPFF